MNNQDKKAWLLKAWHAGDLIAELQASYQEVFDAATSMTAKYSSEGKASDFDPHKFDRVAEYGEKIEQSINQLASVSSEVLDAINQVQDTKLRRVLFLRYIRRMRWEDISDEMGYTKRNVTILHGKALTALHVPEDFL